MPAPNIGETAATTREALIRPRQRLRRVLADQFVNVPGASLVSPQKAGEILKHGAVRGHALTPKQRRLFQSLKHGWTPSRL